jgi:hypothetical protein
VSEAPNAAEIARRHLRLGWWALLVFLSLGTVLEGLHGLKLGFYLDVRNESRRLLWTLAHAHGALLSLVSLAFAASARLPGWGAARLSLASRCLVAALVLIPGGFFLGGAFPYAGDPGPAVIVVPVGALLLFTGVWLTARASGGGSGDS